MAVLISQTSHENKTLKIIFGLFVLAALPFLFIGLLMYGFFLTMSSTSDLSTQPYIEEQWQKSKAFPKVAEGYLPIYQEAGKKYGVPWNLLAAIHKVETDFGRNLSVSHVGARGHMQFMDKTWVGWKYPGGTKLGDLPDSIDITDPKLIQKYGGYGVDANGDGKADPNDPVDAIHAAAKYLAANYKPGIDWYSRKGPVWYYNHDYENYVLKVKEYAETFATPIADVPTSEVASGQFLWPLEGGRVTSQFGARFHPIHKTRRFHNGIDIAKPKGSPILASDGGKVIESRASGGYGWKITIDHGNGYQTVYAHMYPEDVKVSEGQIVSKGQMIALVGSNGWSTGPHLHFEVKRNQRVIDPMTIFKQKVTEEGVQ